MSVKEIERLFYAVMREASYLPRGKDRDAIEDAANAGLRAAREAQE